MALLFKPQCDANKKCEKYLIGFYSIFDVRFTPEGEHETG